MTSSNQTLAKIVMVVFLMPFFAKCDIDTAGEMREMIGDKEHLQHEFNNMFSKEDIRKISREEMAAAWFRLVITVYQDCHFKGCNSFCQAVLRTTKSLPTRVGYYLFDLC